MVTSNRGSQHDSQSTAGQTPRYATFNSTKVLICGYPEDIVSGLSKHVEQEGGKVLKKYYKGSRPDVIVSGSVADRNVKEARKAWQGAVPVVSQTWVEACIKQKAQVDVGPHKLGALAGLEVSATNFPAKERLLLHKMVEQAGGTYSAELHKGRTTHLMCKNGAGKKYSAAVQWRCVHVVSDAWLQDSVALGYPVPEANYKVPPLLEAKTAEPAQPAAAPAAVAPQPLAVPESVMFGSSKQASTAATDQQQQQQQDEAEAEQQEASSKGRAKRTASAAAASAEQQAAPRSRRSSQRLSQPAAAAAQDPAAAAGAVAGDPAGAAAAEAGAAVEPAGAAAAVNATDSRLAALCVTDPEAAPMFLERVVLWWCGVPEGSAEHYELQAILHAYAGVRFPDIQDVTTHILIGTHARLEDLKVVQHFLATCNRRVETVSPAWLQLCHQEQRLVPADARCRVQVGGLVRSAGAAGGGGPLSAAAGGSGAAAGAAGPLRSAAGSGVVSGGGVFANTASRGGFPAEAERQQEGGWVPQYWTERPADPLKLFDGAYFTLAAVQGCQEEHEKALGHIRRLGGKVFTADSTKPPLRWPKVFAVCPASLPRDTEAALMAGDASFRLVHPSCRVTTYWMDKCIKQSELLRVSERNPLLAPLRFALPLRDFANVSIAVTGYKEGQRTTIEKLVVLLGGTFCHTLGRQQRATHLMLPRWGPDRAADGSGAAAGGSQPLPESTVKKIAYAVKHRLEMVVSEWLLDCAAEGRQVQEGLHRPEGDRDLLDLPAAGPTQAAGATQLGGTQLAQTQSQAVLPAGRQAPSAAAAGTGTRSLAALLSGQAPVPRPPAPAAVSRPTAAAAAADGGGNEAVFAVPAPVKPNWFTANKVSSSSRSSQQQQQQQEPLQDEQQRQQEQQQQQAAADKVVPLAHAAAAPQPSVTPGRSSRKRSAAAAGADAGPGSDQQEGAEAAAAGPEGEQPDNAHQQQQHKRQCKQQPPAQQEDVAAGGMGSRAGSEPQQAPAAAAAAAAAAAGSEPGTEGHDAALTDVLSMLASISNNRDAHLPASQAMAGDMLQLPDTLLSAGRGASGGPSGAAGSGSGGAGSGGAQSGGQGVRGRRRTGGLSRASSGGAGSGGPEGLDPSAAEPGGGSSGGSAAGQGGAKRLRRSSGAAAAKSAAGSSGGADGGPGGAAAAAGMLPPARKAPGAGGAAAAAAGGGQAGVGGGRYGTRRSAMSAMPTDAFEPSQQVGYDVGDTPEAMLQAGGRGQRRTATDARKQADMLKRLKACSGK